MRLHRKYRQLGQALPLALVLLAAVAATVFFMFNSGQLVQEKIRVTNTADAVAYSAGTFEARVLNYDAYTNRAMIANEIAIGQAVGLASWAKYAGTAAENIGPWLNLIPYIGTVLAEIMDEVATIMDEVTPVFAAAVTLHDATLNALSLSQQAVSVSSLLDRRWLMNRVAKSNDPDIEVDLIPMGDDYWGFTQRYSSSDERQRMARLITDDRDAFMRNRSWNLGLSLFGCIGMEMRRRGSTELIGVDGWKSMDTVSAHEYWISWGWLGPRCRHSETPVGYGTAYSDDGLDDSGYSYAGSRGTNPNASSYADSTVAEGFEPSTISGGAVPAFYDLSQDVMDKQKGDPRTSMAIRLTKAANKQRYSGGVSNIKPSGRLDLYAGNQADSVLGGGPEMAALSRVEVYFERPDGTNKLFGREEYGNLFNPYWQTRLIPVSAAQRAAAQLIQGRLLP